MHIGKDGCFHARAFQDTFSEQDRLFFLSWERPQLGCLGRSFVKLFVCLIVGYSWVFAESVCVCACVRARRSRKRRRYCLQCGSSKKERDGAEEEGLFCFKIEPEISKDFELCFCVVRSGGYPAFILQDLHISVLFLLILLCKRSSKKLQLKKNSSDIE